MQASARRVTPPGPSGTITPRPWIWPRMKSSIRLADLVEPVGLGAQLDLALGGELYQLEQLHVVADEVPDHLDLAEDHIYGRQ
jgi:hypothetical protein